MARHLPRFGIKEGAGRSAVRGVRRYLQINSAHAQATVLEINQVALTGGLQTGTDK
jgi:hypothetical protein